MIKRNVHLFVFGITRQADDFHPVEQRRRDIQGIAGGHEHHIGQIEINLDVMVLKGVVLFRIKDLKQGRRRITAEIRPHLVNFIKQEQGVAHRDLAHVLKDLSGH